ncbi:helix-turn-helix transcriptional regulator [Microbacterium marinilacus]|uniref:Helix-turn-helix transcriptional regulator n=1 Tax=Microbacterium marinilacus TaxID=415209 RepID=A0ABP7B3A6_9MICO|nr:helix-turn-helix transcriptional regulator [Microbacterium marinilacus]MBY0687937.1 helix-turn-helix transcriptional regulator [Microbacterium marinilacus]
MIDRPALADFLRRRREQVRPADVGLRGGSRRRTPGLRREEVAQLAGISTDHYTRLEQARGSAPSASVVAAVARALQCDEDQRDHLFHLVGIEPPRRRGEPHVRPGLIRLAGLLGDVPVILFTDVGEVVWRNPLAAALMTDLPEEPGRARNVIWRWFTDPDGRIAPRDDWERLGAAHVSDLRATHARRAGDPDVSRLVADLLRVSEEFRELWQRHDVAVRRQDRKTFLHPRVGAVELRCEVLVSEAGDVRLLAYFPLEGTDAADRLDLLRVIGTQDLRIDAT